MSKIFGTNIDNDLHIFNSNSYIQKKIKYNNWHFELVSDKKFENDKIIFEDEKYIGLLDGVMLNLKCLLDKYKAENLQTLIKKMYITNGEKFFSEFRGNFSGCFYDKNKDMTLIFTNHFGDKTIFYNQLKNKVIFSTKIDDIVKFMQKQEIKYTLSKAGIYCLLTYGYMYNDITPFNEIKRLLPGSYLKIKGTNCEIKKYYNFINNVYITETEDEIIDNIEKKFQYSVQLQLEKNKEYDYKDLAPLSAGLDSRMTNYVIKKIHKEPILNITYSETMEEDFKVPMKISNELKNHWLFKNLNNGLALYSIDDMIKYTDGIIYYMWPSQLNDFTKLIEKDNLGIIHTGVIGDVVIGTFFKDLNKKQYELGDGAFSKKLLSKLRQYVDIVNYSNYEEGMMYNRACNGAILGYSMTFQEFTEAMSPFMNVDFFDYCMSIPIKYRFNHNIYYKWVNKYHPEAAKYSHNGVDICAKRLFKILYKGRIYSIRSIFDLLKNKCKAKYKKNYGMNPVDYWYNNNFELKTILDDYYSTNINLVKDFEIKNDMMNLYKVGNTIEKIQVISVLMIIKKYFKEQI